MVNILNLLDRLLPWLLKPAGVRPELVQIDPQTTMNFWVPNRKPDKSKPKPGLVFLHGFAANAILTWQFQVLSVGKNYDVYIPDLLFFGDSITDRPDRSPEFQAECVWKGLKKLGVEKCVVVGFSYGVIVGFKLAQMFPDMVEAMVVTSAPAELKEKVSRRSLEKMGFKSWPELLVPTSANGVKSLLQIGSYWFPPLPRWVLRHYLEAMVMHKKERAELLDAMIVPDEYLTPTVHRYPQRIHIIWGENDSVFDVQLANSLKQELGEKATMDLIDKAGHLAHLERPFVYNNCLNKFLHSLEKDKRLHH